MIFFFCWNHLSCNVSTGFFFFKQKISLNISFWVSLKLLLLLLLLLLRTWREFGHGKVVTNSNEKKKNPKNSTNENKNDRKRSRGKLEDARHETGKLRWFDFAFLNFYFIYSAPFCGPVRCHWSVGTGDVTRSVTSSVPMQPTISRQRKKDRILKPLGWMDVMDVDWLCK